ncbi:MAG: DNA primase, partial [Bdellovibrionales bacterium]|nr:DNA primase [Bdellovibrionales bacterium]
NEQERSDAIQKLQSSDCVYLYDHFGHDDYDAIRSVIRHMVLGYGCKVIFLDHITALTDGQGNEANALAEKMMKELSSMARELKFNLQVISHVRKSDNSRKPAEEGGRVKIDDLKGSGAVKQWSNFVIALERNQQSEDADEARTTTVRILKARGAGKNVGKTVKVKYLPETATLVQADEAFVEDLPF